MQKVYWRQREGALSDWSSVSDKKGRSEKTLWKNRDNHMSNFTRGGRNTGQYWERINSIMGQVKWEGSRETD